MQPVQSAVKAVKTRKVTLLQNDVRKVWYRTSHLGSTLFAVDENGKSNLAHDL